MVMVLWRDSKVWQEVTRWGHYLCSLPIFYESPTTHDGVQRVFEVALYLFLMSCIPSTYNVSLDSLKRESSKIWNVTFQFSSANEMNYQKVACSRILQYFVNTWNCSWASWWIWPHCVVYCWVNGLEGCHVWFQTSVTF